MSISTIATKDTYAGNASISTAYPVTFKYLSSDHVTVYADGVDITNTCSFAGDGTTGTGEFTTAAYAPTTTITVVLDVPLDQPVVLQEAGTLPAKTIEVEGFDRLNMQIRRVWRKLGDVLTFSSDEGGTGSTGTADNLLGFDGSGDITEIPNTTFLQTANDLSDVTAATARTNLNVDVAGTDNSTDVTLSGTGTQASLVGQALTINKITAGDLNSESATIGQVLQSDGDTTCSFVDLIGGGNAQTANPLSQFAATTSAELAGVISDETGTGALVFATSPTLVTPALGTPSAVDLTNATNTPLPAAGTITEAMLNASTNTSLDLADTALQSIAANSITSTELDATTTTSLGLADTAIQTETNGTVQGTDGTRDIKAVASDDTVTPNARGENSVDLQMERALATQVAGGEGSAILGGRRNTASGTGSSVVGGFTNVASGINSICLGGRDGIADGDNSLTTGNEARAGGFAGARVFGDSTGAAITAIQADEFAIQGSCLRLIDGNEGAGKVLTSDANGSGNWAAPAKVVYTYATLPATPAQGDVAICSNANSTTFYDTFTDSGADNVVPVFYDGTNWRIG